MEIFTLFFPKLTVSLDNETVKAVVIDAVKMPDNAMPKMIHNAANTLASNDRGHLSPYLEEGRQSLSQILGSQ